MLIQKAKKPITAHGFKDASSDWQQIEAWYQEHPNCAWGTPTSAERGVLDIDPRHNGHITLAKLEAKHGALPLTPKVKTSGGGWHYWLRFPAGTPCCMPYGEDGGNIEAINPYLSRLQSALAFAKSAGELKRDAEADVLWESVYPSLYTSGDSVPHTDRARPYAVRLSMLYALADESHTIKVEHLKSALAVWMYCRESASLIFGGQQEPKPEAEPLYLQVLSAIVKSPGIEKQALTTAFKNRIKAPQLDENLRYLEEQGLAYRMMLQAKGKGRPAECWFAGKPDGDGLGIYLTSLLPSAETSSPTERGEDCHPNRRVKSRVSVKDISPPPNASLEAEADESLDAEAFLSAVSQEQERGRL